MWKWTILRTIEGLDPWRNSRAWSPLWHCCGCKCVPKFMSTGMLLHALLCSFLWPLLYLFSSPPSYIPKCQHRYMYVSTQVRLAGVMIHIRTKAWKNTQYASFSLFFSSCFLCIYQGTNSVFRYELTTGNPADIAPALADDKNADDYYPGLFAYFDPNDDGTRAIAIDEARGNIYVANKNEGVVIFDKDGYQKVSPLSLQALCFAFVALRLPAKLIILSFSSCRYRVIWKASSR